MSEQISQFLSEHSVYLVTVRSFDGDEFQTVVMCKRGDERPDSELLAKMRDGVAEAAREVFGEGQDYAIDWKVCQETSLKMGDA